MIMPKMIIVIFIVFIVISEKNNSIIFYIQIDPEMYGVDPGDIQVDVEDEASNHVQVPETPLPIDGNAWSELEQTINPNRPSDCHGVDIFMEVLEFIMQRQAQPS
jgi:hypothetical protein